MLIFLWNTFVFAKTSSAGQGGAVYYDASKHAQREGVRRPKLGSHNGDLAGHLTGDLPGDPMNLETHWILQQQLQR